MRYNLKGTHIAITPELRAYVEKKFSVVEKFLHNDTSAYADIELEFREHEGGKKHRAEFTLTARHAMYRTEARAESMHEAIDLAVGEIVGELSRHKKKRLHAVRRGAARVKDVLRGLRDRF